MSRIQFIIFVYLIVSIQPLVAAINLSQSVFIPRSWLRIEELIREAERQSGVRFNTKIEDTYKKIVLYDHLTNLAEVTDAIHEYYTYVLGVNSEIFIGSQYISFNLIKNSQSFDEFIKYENEVYTKFNKGIKNGVAIINKDIIEILPVSIIKKPYIHQYTKDKRKFTIRKYQPNLVVQDNLLEELNAEQVNNTKPINEVEQVSEKSIVERSKILSFLVNFYIQLKSKPYKRRFIQAVEFVNPEPYGYVYSDSNFNFDKDQKLRNKNFNFNPDPYNRVHFNTKFDDLPGVGVNESIRNVESFNEVVSGLNKKIKERGFFILPEKNKKSDFYYMRKSRGGKKTNQVKYKFFSSYFFKKANHTKEKSIKPLRRTTRRTYKEAESIFDDLFDAESSRKWNSRKYNQ